MALTIMRRIKFCAGHRLHRHGGKCEFFHGHNYTADFYVTAQETDDVGRVIDFADLKRLFKGWLDEHWDHGFVLNESDENGIRVDQASRALQVLSAAEQSDGREHGALSAQRSLPAPAGRHGRDGDESRHLGDG